MTGLQTPKMAINPNTNSIDWPDSAIEESARTVPAPPDATGIIQAQRSSAYCDLLACLETSLQSSHTALMARDVLNLENLTREQSAMCQEISRLRAALCLNSDRESTGDTTILAASVPLMDLRTAEVRVLHLGRVQCLLLKRLEKWSRILNNLAGGGESGRAMFCSEPGNSGRHRWF